MKPSIRICWIAAEKELADAIEVRTEADEQKSKAIPLGGMAGFGQGLVEAGYTDDLREAQALVDDLTAHEEEARKAYEENEQTIKDLSQALADYNTEMQDAGTSSQELNDVLNSYAEKAAALGEAAQAAYDDAYNGISGSFGLFDKVSLEIETSVSDMIAALDSQAQYIADYQSNLQAAMDMGIDEGLIAALSDGSQESAAYLQEIVNAGSGSVDELNAAFAKVQEGKDEFSKTVEEMQTDFAGQMDALLAELNATIGEMDLHDQAAQSGYNTVKGFTDAANDPEMQAYVRNAYAMMAEQVTMGINSALDIHSPSKVTEWSGEMTGYGLIEGVENTIPDMQKAMREYAESATEAMEASQIVMLSPTFMQQVSAMYAGNPESADEISVSPSFVGGSKVEMHVTYQITNNGDAGDLEEQLSRHDERLREIMLDILNEYEEDAKRTRFS